MGSPFDPDRRGVEAMLGAATTFVADFLAGLPTAPADGVIGNSGTDPVALAVSGPPQQQAGDLDELIARFGAAAGRAVETAGPGYFAYFPAGGLLSAAVADLLSSTVNRYTGVSSLAPALVAMEHGVLRWLCDEFGLPSSSGGVVTTGASLGTLSALVAARHDRLGDGPGPALGTVYVTEHTHYCVAKAARIAGLGPHQIRVVPVDDQQRMDVDAATALIKADRAAGRHPFLLVGTAGTTSTGTVDPLGELADLAGREGLWFHVDAAYGGGFVLTERGRELLRGAERADSLVLDPHKTLFLPYGTGVLLVRDPATLRAAHSGDDPDYLRDLDHDAVLPDWSDLGPELTREFRGLRLWLPLHLHGVAAFRDALDERLDLATYVDAELRTIPGIDVVLRPDLTVSVFRSIRGDDATRRLLDRVNAGRRVFLSSTRVAGRLAVRLCVLSHRTGRDRVDEALAAIREAV